MSKMAKAKVVHWLNKRKRYDHHANYRTAHYGGDAYWAVDCSMLGWAFLEITTDPDKTTCKNCLRTIKAKEQK